MEIQAIIKAASKISTPLMLAGVVISVLWAIFRLILQKSPVWAKQDASPIIVRIIHWTGLLSFTSILLGFIGYFITETEFTFIHKDNDNSLLTDKKVSEQTITKKKKWAIRSEEALSIVQQALMKPADFVLFNEINNKKYIAAGFYPTYEIVIFKSFGNAWEKIMSCGMPITSGKTEDWNIIEVGNKPYLSTRPKLF